MRHTKGKWIAKDVNYTLTKRTEIWSDQDNEEPIFEIIHREVNLSECTPNAKLISKAPEMYEALKAIVNAQYEKGGTLAGLNGTVSNARELLKEFES